MSDEDLEIFVTAYLEPDFQGVLGEFSMTIKSLLGVYVKSDKNE